MTQKDEKEWMFQAEYDLRAAEKNYEIGLYPYTIFMCHLSIEKALKSAYYLKFKKEPPKIHNLTQLSSMLNTSFPEHISDFIDDLATIRNLFIIT